MEKNKLKAKTIKNVAFCDSNKDLSHLNDYNTEIRLGISLADEKAKLEIKKRRVEAPLNIEQKFFLNKL